MARLEQDGSNAILLLDEHVREEHGANGASLGAVSIKVVSYTSLGMLRCTTLGNAILAPKSKCAIGLRTAGLLLPSPPTSLSPLINWG
jgi:hypothetical protein